MQLPYKTERLINLRELMYKYRVSDLALMISSLEMVRRDALNADYAIKSGMVSSSSDLADPSDRWKEALATCLDGAGLMCSGVVDDSIVEQLNALKASLSQEKADLRPCVIHAQLDLILSAIHKSLESTMFMFVPKDEASYWDNLHLFGDEFLSVFPIHAVLEMREVGNCYVAARPTACVFHCMRVAEYGVRLLAKQLKVRLTDKGKLIPIEYGTWNDVIQSIRLKIAEIRKRSKGSKKESDLQFYSDVADHCEYMKDIWRNEISHTRRRSYKREEVLAVINRVRDFVQLLARHETPKDQKRLLEQINKRTQQLQAFTATLGK